MSEFLGQLQGARSISVMSQNDTDINTNSSVAREILLRALGLADAFSCFPREMQRPRQAGVEPWRPGIGTDGLAQSLDGARPYGAC